MECKTVQHRDNLTMVLLLMTWDTLPLAFNQRLGRKISNSALLLHQAQVEVVSHADLPSIMNGLQHPHPNFPNPWKFRA
eukprot:1255283-Amphidinium_carterae.3